MTLDSLADILRSRAVTSVCYFHTDHFEPWSLGVNDSTARGVERLGEMARRSPYAGKLSLFYSAYVPYHLESDATGPIAGDRVPDDKIVFGERSARQENLARDVIRPLVTEDGHEMHLHVHHEWWTRNASDFDHPVSRWVNAHSDDDTDARRLDLFFRLNKEVIGREIGRPFDHWAFIHGNWALAASDPTICLIEDELGLIMRHGGFGDFTFPAGRRHCDPRIAAPFSCLPLPGRRVYDDPAAEPQIVGEDSKALMPGRFFIWNSPIKADFSSLDYYSEANRALFHEPEAVIEQWLRKSVVIGDRLFLKTHSHSLKWEYKMAEPGSAIPHCYPDVVAMFDLLVRTCDRAGVAFQPMTVTEIMQVLRGDDQTDLRPNATGSPARSNGAPVAAVPSPAATPPAGPVIDRFSDPAALEADLGATLLEWLDAAAERRRGAAEFYEQLFERGEFLQPYERAVLDFLSAGFVPAETRIVEVGVGYGFLALALAAIGFDVVAIEGQTGRFDGLAFLAEELCARRPELRPRLRLVCGWYPEALTSDMLTADRRSLLLLTNVVHSMTADHQEAILRTGALFDDLVLDVSRFGVSRYAPGEADAFRARLAATYMLAGSVWRHEPNEICHFRPRTVLGPDPAGVARRTPAAMPQGAIMTEWGGRPLDVEVGGFNAELVALQREWTAGEDTGFQPDELYVAKLARDTMLEPYEIEIAEAVALRHSTDDTVIVEIGSGCGALALLLARHGFDVVSFEGSLRRHAACEHHRRDQVFHHPDLRIRFVAGLFPGTFSPGLIGEGRKAVCVATNITSSYTAEHEDAIFRMAANFDELIVDLARFGFARDAQAERDGLRAALTHSYFDAVEQLYVDPPYEYWRFARRPILTPRAALQPAASAPSPAAVDAAQTQPTPKPDLLEAASAAAAPSLQPSALFPISGSQGLLFSVFGDRLLEACPVCHGTDTVQLWRMPMASLKEPIRLFGGYFNQVPTLQTPGTVFCFDYCRDCESIFLNPIPASQKDEYRNAEHYLKVMQTAAEWQGYEDAYDVFAPWIPGDAGVLIDAACGIGQYLHVAKRRGTHNWRRLIGLELAEKYVAHMRDSGFEAYAFDLDNDELLALIEPGSVDVITFCEAFEHVERPLDALRRLLAVLRPGGRLYLTAQRYGGDVQAAVRPGEFIYIGDKVVKEMPEHLGCRILDVKTSSVRYYIVLEK